MSTRTVRKIADPKRILLIAIANLVLFAIAGSFGELPEVRAADPAASGVRATPQALFVSNDGTFKRYRIPSLIATKKGTLLAICEGRVDGGGLVGNIDLVLRRSLDAGRTWQPLQKIADLGDDTLGNPCPVVDRETGTIWLPFSRSPGQFNETQIVAGQSSGPTTVWVTRSDDEGATWSEPRDISATTRLPKWGWYGTGPGIGIQLASGRMLIPSYHTEPDSGMYRSHAIFSDDHGVTWKLGETVGEHTAECQAIERRDGAVVLNMRGTNKQGFRSTAISRDGGQSWSDPQLDRSLPEPACQAALLSGPAQSGNDGRDGTPCDWVFCNPPGSTRRNLTLRVSRDEGQSWPIAKLIDAGPTEYSCMAWLPDGQLGLLYELTRSGQAYRPELHFARIPASWLTDPASPEPFVANPNSSSAKPARVRSLMFVDDHDVLYRSGTERVLQPAKRLTDKGVISQTMPWEVAIGWTSIHRDAASGKYQLWYQAYAGKRAGDKRLECVVCYAESDDGINFVKPEFDLFPFKEHAKTNIVLIGNGGYGDRYCNSVLVDPREPNAARKYKMAYYDWSMKDGREEAGLHLAFSPDGIHWTKHPDAPLYPTSYGGRGLQPRFADENAYFETPQANKPTRRVWQYPLVMADAVDVFFDPRRETFAMYGKMWMDAPDGGAAWKHGLGRIESRDLLTWSKPQFLIGPDELDDPEHEFHTSPVFVHNDCYLSLNQILNRRAKGAIDIELMTSRDGQRWDRPFRQQPFLARSESGQFDSRSIFTNSTPVMLADEIRFYYGAYNQSPIGGVKSAPGERSGVGVASIPRDRFAGIRSVAKSTQVTLKKPLEHIGQVTLKPLDLTACREITLNADATDGSVRVELLTEDGYRVRGYSKDDAVPITGNSLRHAVVWKERRLEQLPSGRYLLRLHLDHATVFAMSFF